MPEWNCRRRPVSSCSISIPPPGASHADRFRAPDRSELPGPADGRHDAMRKLIYGMNLTLDGCVAAPGDDLGWSAPSDELFQWWLDPERAIGLLLYGRKLWETMSSWRWPHGPDRGMAFRMFRTHHDRPRMVRCVLLVQESGSMPREQGRAVRCEPGPSREMAAGFQFVEGGGDPGRGRAAAGGEVCQSQAVAPFEDPGALWCAATSPAERRARSRRGHGTRRCRVPLLGKCRARPGACPHSARSAHLVRSVRERWRRCRPLRS